MGRAYVEDSMVADTPVEGDSIPVVEDGPPGEGIHGTPVVVVGGDSSPLVEILYRRTDPYPLKIDKSVGVSRRNAETNSKRSQRRTVGNEFDGKREDRETNEKGTQLKRGEPFLQLLPRAGCFLCHQPIMVSQTLRLGATSPIPAT